MAVALFLAIGHFLQHGLGMRLVRFSKKKEKKLQFSTEDSSSLHNSQVLLVLLMTMICCNEIWVEALVAVYNYNIVYKYPQSPAEPSLCQIMNDVVVVVYGCLMKVITASSKRCNKVCELFEQCMSEY